MPVLHGYSIPPLGGAQTPAARPFAPVPAPARPRVTPVEHRALRPFAAILATLLVGWIALWAITNVIQVVGDGIDWVRSSWSDLRHDDEAGTSTAITNYRVRPGDTLSEIAQSRGLTVKKLMTIGNNASKFRNPELIYPGEVVELPTRGGSR